MQTFLPYPSFAMSASVLDNKRLGKQRVEVLQILQALACGPTQYYNRKRVSWETFNELNKAEYHRTRKTTWYNHPATQMWLGYEWSLVNYGRSICFEWITRGFKDTCWDKITSFRHEPCNMEKPTWFGDESFHSSHRAALLAKDYLWYKQFGWKETPALNYIWPSSTKKD